MHQIVSNQGGEFKVWRQSDWAFFLVRLPIKDISNSNELTYSVNDGVLK